MTFPVIKSSNDGPPSRVEANECFVEAGVGAWEVVANERMAILQDRWRSSCASWEDTLRAITIPFQMPTKDAEATRPIPSNKVDLVRLREGDLVAGIGADDGVVCQIRLVTKQSSVRSDFTQRTHIFRTSE